MIKQGLRKGLGMNNFVYTGINKYNRQNDPDNMIKNCFIKNYFTGTFSILIVF